MIECKFPRGDVRRLFVVLAAIDALGDDATIGNTAGGMVSYAIGRWIPHKQPIQYEAQMQRHGATLLTMAWAPLIGDALCIAAGWLRLHWLPCLGFMALGKCARYVVLAVAMT